MISRSGLSQPFIPADTWRRSQNHTLRVILYYLGELPPAVVIAVKYPVRWSVICTGTVPGILHQAFDDTITEGIFSVTTGTYRVSLTPPISPSSAGGVQSWRCKGECKGCAIPALHQLWEGYTPHSEAKWSRTLLTKRQTEFILGV